MPTGYTALVGDGTVQDFRTFALQCARNFGACITQRDEPISALPQHRKESDTYVKWLRDAKEQMARLVRMTPAEAKAAYEADYAKRLASHEEYQAKRDATRERYEAMLVEVELWEPPTPQHQNLKDFMRQQLTESIRFDCSSLPAPARQDPMVWYQEQVDDAAQSIERYAADVEAERTRVQNANAWIDALYESLETPTAEAPHA